MIPAFAHLNSHVVVHLLFEESGLSVMTVIRVSYDFNNTTTVGLFRL